MKRLLLALLFFMALAATKAQDRIVTVQNDTIECLIISVGDKRIIYEQESTEDYATGKSISLSNVLHYYRSNRAIENRGTYGASVWGERSERPYLFTLEGGLARLSTDFSDYENSITGSALSVSEVDDYIGKLKNGFHINAAIHYLRFTNFGVGVEYSLFYSASELDFFLNGYNQIEVPTFANISMDEKIYIHFFGPSVLFQQFPDNKGKIRISESLSPGIVMFRNEIRSKQYLYYLSDYFSYVTGNMQYFENFNSVTTGSTFGIKGGVSIEYFILPQLSAGLSGKFIWAKLQKASYKSASDEINDQDLETAINVSHLDYGFTLRCNF